MTEKELQKLFQKKFADREVPYNPEAWTHLEKMLDKAATPWYARKSFFYQSSAVVAAVAITAGVYFNWPDQPQGDNLIPVDSNSDVMAPSQQESGPNENISFEEAAEVEAISNDPSESSLESSSLESSATESISTTNQGALATEESVSSSAFSSQSDEALASEPITSSEIDAEEIATVETLNTEEEVSDAETNLAEESSTSDQSDIDNTRLAVSAAATTALAASPSTASTDLSTPEASSNSEESLEEVNTLAEEPIASDEARSASEMDLEEANQALTAEEETEEGFHISVLDPFNPDDYQVKLLDVQLDEPDIVEPLVGPKSRGLRSDFSWSAFAMFGFGNELRTDENSGSGLAAFGVGTGLKWNFSETLGLETSLNYTRRNDLSIQRLFEGTDYSFGADRTEILVTAKGADFLEVPLSLNYKFTPAHQVKAGYYAAYMFNLSNNVQERTQGQYEETWTVENRTASGFEEGFNTLDHGLLFGYEWAMLQKFTLGLEYLHGLQDLSKDDIYIDTRKHYNRQLRLRFSYIIE